MHRIVVAFRAFFRILFQAQLAGQVEQLLGGAAAPQPETEPPAAPKLAAKAPATAAAPVRNGALTLLSALQREARFVDFIQEPIAAYSDAQIGAAVRDIHRDCGKLVARLFALEPIEPGAEGSEIDVPAGFDPAQIRLVGNVTGQPPFRGRLAHHGWRATRLDVPEWTGSAVAVFVVAPAEVELR
jgi:hypothetical protein